MGRYVSQSQFRSATLPYLENSVVSKRNTFRRTVGVHDEMKQPKFAILAMTLLFGCSNPSTKDMTETESEGSFEITFKPDNSVSSGRQLKIISVSPNFSPTKDQQRKAMSFINSVFPDNEIKSQLDDEVSFIDPGGTFETVNCNLCGQPIEMDDWQTAMDKSYETKFSDLSFQTPCCDKPSNLNSLAYEAPSGFAKYSIVVINPDREKTDLIKISRGLGEILGSEVRFIWAEY